MSDGQKNEASRVIDNTFRCDLKEGKLKGLTNVVRDSKDLILCFRGSYINVYYKGHNLLKIDKKQNGYNISFNFNHAKFTSNWEDHLNGLSFKLNSTNKLNTTRINKNYPTNTLQLDGSNVHDVYFWKKTIETLKLFIDDYFDQNKKYDYFMKEQTFCRNIIEKQRQQLIMQSNQNFSKGYYIYDMEYMQARNSSKDDSSGRFDMIALRWEGKQVRVVFIELKSTESACKDSKSGIAPHIEDLSKYIEKNDCIRTRKIDAHKIIRLYEDMKLLNPDVLGCIDFSPESMVDSEVLFIFTDEAKDYYINNKDKYPKLYESPFSVALLSDDSWVIPNE